MGRQQQDITVENAVGTSDIPTQQSQKKGRRNRARQPANFGSETTEVGVTFAGDKLDDQLDSGEESSIERKDISLNSLTLSLRETRRIQSSSKGKGFLIARSSKKFLKTMPLLMVIL